MKKKGIGNGRSRRFETLQNVEEKKKKKKREFMSDDKSIKLVDEHETIRLLRGINGRPCRASRESVEDWVNSCRGNKVTRMTRDV